MIDPESLDRQRDQRTNVLDTGTGTGTGPTSVSAPVFGVTGRVHGNGRVETYEVASTGRTTAARFFGPDG